MVRGRDRQGQTGAQPESCSRPQAATRGHCSNPAEQESDSLNERPDSPPRRLNSIGIGLRTYGRNRGCAAPHSTKCFRASARLSGPFTVSHTLVASSSSCPSSSHQQTEHNSSTAGADSVRYPQHGQRYKFSTSQWTDPSRAGLRKRHRHHSDRSSSPAATSHGNPGAGDQSRTPSTPKILSIGCVQ